MDPGSGPGSASGDDCEATFHPLEPKQYPTRRIGIKLLYLGWDFDGMMLQEKLKNTIEEHLFNALIKTTMISDRNTCGYQRSGRTDISVSAFAQVISLDVKSNGKEDLKDELNYPYLLNRCLPKTIQCLSWSPVQSDFSARFNCKRRMYKYFFPKSSLDIEKMRRGADYLVGQHDFKNFCKLDANNCNKTIRDVYETRIEESEDNMVTFKITARGFLWHQIRCIISILLLIGERKEEPQLVKQLLDLQTFPHKPQYQLASGLPLVLYDCLYSDEDVQWIVDRKTLTDVMLNMQGLWTEYNCKATIIRNMMSDMSHLLPDLSKIHQEHDCLSGEKGKKRHKKICDRPVSDKF